MNQLAVIDDLAARRSAAARKAVATRRARLAGVNPHAVLAPLKRDQAAEVLALFERESAADMPDWHKVALAMKQALARPQMEPRKVTRQAPAIAAPAWPDYRVDQLGSFKVRNPTIVVTFADGEVVRAPAVSAKDKPVNIGRGLRVAIAFYQARALHRRGLRLGGRWLPSAPAITACICEDSGESFDPKVCTFQRRPQGRQIEDKPT